MILSISRTVEALYAANSNPVLNLLAMEGIRSLSSALPTLMASPGDNDARYTAFYGAWLCAICLGNSEMGLHHKLCHTLGGSFNFPHAETHTIMLPHVLAYNAPSIPSIMKKLADVIPESNGDAINGLNVLLAKLKVKKALRDFGMREEDVEKAAQIAVGNPYKNPAEIEYERIRETIRRAWAGEDARIN
jgi:alcohol dehydrogenase class IV